MSDTFEIEVSYKGSQLSFPARFARLGYTYKIFVEVYQSEIIFEPDEERNFRAVAGEQAKDLPKTDIELIKAIGAALEEALK